VCGAGATRFPTAISGQVFSPFQPSRITTDPDRASTMISSLTRSACRLDPELMNIRRFDRFLTFG